ANPEEIPQLPLNKSNDVQNSLPNNPEEIPQLPLNKSNDDQNPIPDNPEEIPRPPLNKSNDVPIPQSTSSLSLSTHSDKSEIDALFPSLNEMIKLLINKDSDYKFIQYLVENLKIYNKGKKIENIDNIIDSLIEKIGDDHIQMSHRLNRIKRIVQENAF